MKNAVLILAAMLTLGAQNARVKKPPRVEVQSTKISAKKRGANPSSKKRRHVQRKQAVKNVKKMK